MGVWGWLVGWLGFGLGVIEKTGCLGMGVFGEMGGWGFVLDFPVAL